MIGIEHTGFTSLGTSTTKTQLGGADIILPAWAKSILAVIPVGVIDTVTAAQSLVSKFELESDDFDVSPYQVEPAPVAGLLGASGGSLFTGKAEKYPCGAICNGGDRLRAYMTALVANTSAPYGGAGIVISDQPAGHPQRKSKMGTVTSTGTSASADVAGTAYTFTGGHRITELFGSVTGTTVAAADGIIAYMKYMSNEFVRSAPLKLPLNGLSGGLGTLTIAFVDGTSRAPVDVPISSPTTIQDYLYMGLAPGTAGYFVSGVMFE